jgi:molecular chaperone GrpE (heat shock protein)
VLNPSSSPLAVQPSPLQLSISPDININEELPGWDEEKKKEDELTEKSNKRSKRRPEYEEKEREESRLRQRNERIVDEYNLKFRRTFEDIDELKEFSNKSEEELLRLLDLDEDGNIKFHSQ